jgi:hypothetical protein
MEVARAIQVIEQQTGKVFSYSNRLLDVSAPFTPSAADLSLDEALKQMLAGKNLAYTHKNQYIVIHSAEASRSDGRRDGNPDVYSPTPVNSLGSGPLRRPTMQVDRRPVVRRMRVVEPDTVSSAAYHSDYHALDNYFHAEKYLPLLAVKTNLLYAAGTLTPNLALEVGLGYRTSLNLSGSYNPWNRVGTLENNDKRVHFVIRPEFRYWFCERFEGHFVSISPFYDQFNISGYGIPFVKFRNGYRYEGNAFGAGLNYGHQMLLSNRWGLEFSVGVGLAQMKYDRFECPLCRPVLDTTDKLYFGPTHVAVNLIFMIR